MTENAWPTQEGAYVRVLQAALEEAKQERDEARGLVLRFVAVFEPWTETPRLTVTDDILDAASDLCEAAETWKVRPSDGHGPSSRGPRL